MLGIPGVIFRRKKIVIFHACRTVGTLGFLAKVSSFDLLVSHRRKKNQKVHVGLEISGCPVLSDSPLSKYWREWIVFSCIIILQIVIQIFGVNISTLISSVVFPPRWEMYYLFIYLFNINACSCEYIIQKEASYTIIYNAHHE